MGLPEIKDLITAAAIVAGIVIAVRKDRRESREEKRKQAESEDKE